MKNLILMAVLGAFGASAANATGGLVCSTAGPRPIEVSLGFPHGFGAPLFATRLRDNGRDVPVTAPQWWLDNSEVRLLLFKPNEHRQELVLRAKRKGHVYDGNVWRGGQRRWVRCREG
jgi:hypothetical protein